MEQQKGHSKLLICLTLWAVLHYSTGMQVLILTPFGTPSHLYTLKEIGSALTARGHKVTIVGSYPTKVEPNMTFIYTKTPVEVFSENFELAPLDQSIWNQYPLIWLRFLNTLIHACDVLYEKDLILQLTRADTSKYDVIIIDSLIQECVLPVAHKLGKPIVFFSAGPLCPATSKQLGIPLPFSYVPHFMATLTSEMTLYERLLNTITHASWIIMYEWWYYPAIDRISRKHLKDAPPVTNIIRNVSIAMAASDGVLAAMRPAMPFFVDVGGIQCKPSKPLPKEFETIVNKAQDGFIIFSLGTWMDGLFFSPEVRRAFMEAFSKLKQVVLWKHHGKEDNLPPNVKLFSWLPQQDLLGHPKIKVFITHGGIHGLYEAVYHGVPIVGLGIFADQKPNLLRAVHKGFALTLDENNITSEGVYKTISTVISDPSFKASATKLSSILRDQPQTPMERALYWIEYAARHQGTDHFRSPAADLNFFQYFLLDIILVGTVCLAVIISVIVMLIKNTLRFPSVDLKPQPNKHNKIS